MTYVIIDGTLIPIDQIATDRPFFSGTETTSPASRKGHYSRPIQVATHASLPSSSARVHHIGACASETR